MCQNLSNYQICIFPDDKINHFENQTPFLICEDNIFQRRVNLNPRKNGLGISVDQMERMSSAPNTYFKQEKIDSLD